MFKTIKMPKSFFFILLVILSDILFAQVDGNEIQKDIHRIMYRGDDIFNQGWVEDIYRKIRLSPGPYISYIQSKLHLPEYPEILQTSRDSLSHYRALVGILYNIGTPEGKRIVLEEYYKQSALLHRLDYEEAKANADEGLPFDEYIIISDAADNLYYLQTHMVLMFGHHKDTSLVRDCLDRLLFVNAGLGYPMLGYFMEVSKGDLYVINRLLGIYFNPNGEWFNANSLKKVIEELGGTVEFRPDVVIDEMIRHVNRFLLNFQHGDRFFSSVRGDEVYSICEIDNEGVANSLIVKLENAKKNIEKEKLDTAVNDLDAFVNELEAQREKHITQGAYEYLKKFVESVRAKVLGK